MKKIFLIPIYILLFCTSCKKFLEEKTDGQISSDKFYQTEADVIASANGIYQAMRADVNDGQMWPLTTTEIISDDAIPEGTVTGERLDLENVVYNAQHAYTRRVWAAAYRVIDRANNLLLYATDSSKISPPMLRRVRAEAQFFRAFYYFRLVQLFGDVPLMLEPANVTKNNLQPARSSSKVVYQLILDDLKYAEKNLEDTYSYTSANGGRVTKAAAKALLGKVYLTMAGFPLKDTQKYQLAADKLKELIDNKATYNLDLNPNYANIFSADIPVKAADKERIFYIRGASGFPSNLQAYTRMKYNYVQYSLLTASSDFLPHYFSAGTTTYSALSGGTPVPSVQTDDAISVALPIGFAYNFGGSRYDKFYMSSNGFISFINRSNAAPNISTVRDPLIGPLMDNLNGTGGAASYATTGTAPNRVLTIEWRNWRWKTGTTIANNISFQVKLYEMGGKFEMLYNQTGDPVNSTATAVGFRAPTFYCSIRNSAAAPDFNWAYSPTSYSASVKGFQPGQIFTITPNPEGVFEWADMRRQVTFNFTTNRLGVVKYNDQINTGYNDNADDFHWLRYSDVLLMYAEALIEIGGSTNMDIALEQINLIRRAHGGTSGSPAVPILADLTYSSQDNLREQLRLERRREFAFEAQRWYDLKRWGIMPEVLREQLSRQYNQPLSNYSYITNTVMFLPIPYSERLNNPNLSQNDGY
ncbi:RagB/SusD family nutrient uptake outer membrane protein [Pedobacter nutrimenti]|uniref:RagB/SusD family nutrient uptake outer membrane protein n=1 Tax=Pedobacter nutrimenti TaxID=1241337 RepID=UPI00292DB656|nr:RagB/SusD family nutrient uptake outer membrane protein [Pedobacter nutrimenti]